KYIRSRWYWCSNACAVLPGKVSPPDTCRIPHGTGMGGSLSAELFVFPSTHGRKPVPCGILASCFCALAPRFGSGSPVVLGGSLSAIPDGRYFLLRAGHDGDHCGVGLLGSRMSLAGDKCLHHYGLYFVRLFSS